VTLALVTGAPGWLGTRLVHVLRHGMVEVPALGPSDRGIRCLVLPNVDIAPLQNIEHVEIIRGDIRDPEAAAKLCEGADGATLFHCAAVIHPTGGAKEFFEVNAKGTENVVHAAERAKIRRFIHVSSNSPFGTNPSRDHLFDESAPYNPYMGYGESKRRAELSVKAAHDRGVLQTVIIRPPWFYGPGQPPRQTLFFEMIRDGKAPIVGDGENRRSMAYVDNICQALLLCERVPHASGGAYWIADARPYTMNEIIDTIERVMERDFGVKCDRGRMRLPGLASEIAWLVDKVLQGMGLYDPKIHVLSEMNKTIACSIEKARRELGYDPKIALEEGMRRSIAWMLANGAKL
jgi:nucleoside-diphosphate-sugar epimerase